MYLEHYGLCTHPFSMSPKLDFVFQSTAFEESMAHLVYGLDHHEAIVLVTGPIGMGKTMALQSFLSRLGDRYDFALITNSRINALELLKLVLEDLGVDLSPGADKSDLLIEFKRYLQNASAAGKTVLVVVDEAQNLASEVLEELRLLTNLGQGDLQPVQVVLVGQPELAETVKRPDLEQLRQRIRVHYSVEPLTRDETEAYLNHRMNVAGGQNGVFSRDAIDRIYRLTRGVPRLVNTAADTALLSAYVAGRKRIEANDVTTTDEIVHVDSQLAATQTSARVDRSRPGEVGRNHRARRRFSRGSAALVALVVVVGAIAFYWAHRTVRETTVTVNESLQVVDVAPTDSTVVDSVEAPTPVASEPPVVVPDLDSTAIFLHVASFRSLDRALTYVEDWPGDEVGVVARSESIDGSLWHRVYLGPLKDKEDARELARRLQRDGVISYYAVRELLLAP